MKVYVWRNAKGEIEVAFEKLPGVPGDVQEIIVDDLRRIIFDEVNQRFRVMSDEEFLDFRKKKLLIKLKQKVHYLLLSTDWVITKCVELGYDPWVKYSDTMSQRKRIRELNDELEEKIKEAKTLQELEEIEQEIMRLG